MRRRTKWGIAVAALALLTALAWSPVSRHVEAATLLLRFEDPSAEVEGVERRDLELAGLRARRYAVDGGPPVLLVHGVHPSGIDEPLGVAGSLFTGVGGRRRGCST